jgi:splicing factor 3A subunit 3
VFKSLIHSLVLTSFFLFYSIDRKGSSGKVVVYFLIMSIIEDVRSLHETIERCHAAAVQQLMIEPLTLRHRIVIDHFIAKQIDAIASTADRLSEYYDEEGLLKELLEATTRSAPLQGNDLEQAVKRFKDEVSAQRKYFWTNPQPDWKEEFETITLDNVNSFVRFATAEKFGRCLDLTRPYSQYKAFMVASATGLEEAGFVVDPALSPEDFVAQFHKVYRSLPIQRKLLQLDQYRELLEECFEYVRDFRRRVAPLQESQTDATLRTASEEFERKWEQGLSRSWAAPRQSAAVQAKTKEVARLEDQLGKLVGLLATTLSETEKYVRSRATRTVAELQRDLEEEEEDFVAKFNEAVKKAGQVGSAAGKPAGEAAGASDGAGVTMKATDYSIDELSPEEQAKYTGLLDIPRDADGNPISKWIIKMQQLDRVFHCTICNESYRGPKVFQEHFSDRRHLEGLQKLGIPEYVPALKLITNPETAVTTYREYVRMLKGKRLAADEVEVEDVRGMVSTRQTLNMLRRAL